MKNVLLTGASGFIGRNICDSFLCDKYSLLTPSRGELDLLDERMVDDFFKKNKIDIVIHAAVKPTHRNAKNLDSLLYSNLRMFMNLEKHSQSYEKMLVLGSGAIYDLRLYEAKMVEDSYIKHLPADEHGFCKYVCERIIEKSDNIYDLRIFGVFGKYEDYEIRFISNAICKCLFNLPISLKQNRKFDYLFIDDLMPIIDWFVLNKPRYKAYNITPDKSLFLYDIATIVRKVSKKDFLDIHVSSDGIGLEYSGDNTRLRKEFLEVSFTPIEDAILKLYHWYEEHKYTIDEELLLFDK